jgi:hypothetical protein
VLLVSPLEGNPYNPLGRGDELLNLESEALLVRSDAVADAVIHRLDLATTSALLLEEVSVEVPPNTQLLRITTSAPSAAAAHDLADSFARAFLDYRAERTRSTRLDQAASLREQVQERSSDRDRLVGQLEQLPASSMDTGLLEQRVVDLSTQIGVLRARLTELELGSSDPGQVVTPALADPTPVLARRPLVAGVGGVLGAVLGLVLLRLGRGRWWWRGSRPHAGRTAPRAVPHPGTGAAAPSIRVTVARRLVGRHGAPT